ncbi:MAG TPA: hypothetical protein VJR89_40345 [Polyangiales bacterium]|nr:hypothetical protein [Polyangiales bacterium]
MDEQRKNPYRRERRAATKPRGEDRPKRPGLRQLPNDLHDLAEGRVDRLRRPRRQPDSQLADERGGHVIPGVRNSEARSVYDRRVQLLRAAAQRGDEDALRRGLCEAMCLGLWRARNIIDFDAFADDVLGVDSARAHALLSAASPGPQALVPEIVALWIRTEAAALHVSADATVRLAGDAEQPKLQLEWPVHNIEQAVEVLKSVGPAVTGLTRLLR